jgi:hypothetical protein
MVEHGADREAVLESLQRILPFCCPGSKTETSVCFAFIIDKQMRIGLRSSLEGRGLEENIWFLVKVK